MDKKTKLLFAILILAFSAYVFNCTPENLTGDPVVNIPPTINFTNLPINDSVYSFNATIYWFGEDEDGQVMYYYYYVVLEEDIPGGASGVDDFIANVLPTVDIEDWTRTEETELTIQMYASADETDTLHQFVFVKCQDDDEAFSPTIYYSVFRVNHLPETAIEALPGVNIDSSYILPVWSLADTNSLWTGLTIAWDGDDSLDFPEGAPDFEYEWKLFGPYDTSAYSIDDEEISLVLSDTTGDSLFALSCSDNDGSYLLIEEGITAGDCEETWVWDTEVNLTGLPTGCYIFTVRTRDDALVPDTSSAWGTFIVIEPLWINHPEDTKDILVIQSTQFNTNHALPFYGWPPDYAFVSEDSFYVPDEVVDFYSEMIEGAGSYTYDIYGVPAVGPLYNTPSDIPPMSVLARYRMIIFDDMDYMSIELNSPSQDPFVLPLINYLSIGGKAWVLGRQSFMTAPGASSGRFDFAAGTLAVDFFDLSSAIYTAPNFNNMTYGHLGEFVGTSSTFEGFDDLETDSLRTLLFHQYGLNKVEVFSRNSAFSRTLYTYNAANPDTMTAFQYMPCALRYYPEHELFKTSYFSFPLFMMDNSEGQVQAVFTDMLQWFFEEY